MRCAPMGCSPFACTACYSCGITAKRGRVRGVGEAGGGAQSWLCPTHLQRCEACLLLVWAPHMVTRACMRSLRQCGAWLMGCHFHQTPSARLKVLCGKKIKQMTMYHKN